MVSFTWILKKKSILAMVLDYVKQVQQELLKTYLMDFDNMLYQDVDSMSTADKADNLIMDENFF